MDIRIEMSKFLWFLITLLLILVFVGFWNLANLPYPGAISVFGLAGVLVDVSVFALLQLKPKKAKKS